MEAVLFLDSKEETRPVDRRVSFEAILTKIVTFSDLSRFFRNDRFSIFIKETYKEYCYY